jgi:hypothetical protein
VLHSKVLELLVQCNLDAPPTSFPQCTVRSFYEWVNACFDLITMNTKIFGDLGAAVGVRMLAYSVCSLVSVDRPSSEKTISKSDLWRLMKDDFGWPSNAELDVSKLPVLAKNLAKNFMNTFFAERGSRLTLDESVRLNAQVRRSDLYSRTDAFNCPRITMMCSCLFAVVQIGPRLQAQVTARLRSRHSGAFPQPLFMEENNWIGLTGIPLIATEGTTAEGAARAVALALSKEHHHT